MAIGSLIPGASGAAKGKRLIVVGGVDSYSGGGCVYADLDATTSTMTNVPLAVGDESTSRQKSVMSPLSQYILTPYTTRAPSAWVPVAVYRVNADNSLTKYTSAQYSYHPNLHPASDIEAISVAPYLNPNTFLFNYQVDSSEYFATVTVDDAGVYIGRPTLTTETMKYEYAGEDLPFWDCYESGLLRGSWWSAPSGGYVIYRVTGLSPVSIVRRGAVYIPDDSFGGILQPGNSNCMALSRYLNAPSDNDAGISLARTTDDWSTSTYTHVTSTTGWHHYPVCFSADGRFLLTYRSSLTSTTASWRVYDMEDIVSGVPQRATAIENALNASTSAFIDSWTGQPSRDGSVIAIICWDASDRRRLVVIDWASASKSVIKNYNLSTFVDQDDDIYISMGF